MLPFVQSLFNPASSPIGVDFGSDCLRMAQVEFADGEYQLTAAASADVPLHVRNDANARFAFFAETVRDLLIQGNFRGRRAVLNLPASMMHIQHLRLPKMDDEALKKALPWEARGKLPFDPSQAVLRHLIAGEIYHDQEPKYEIILMAARRDLVDMYLAAAKKARLDLVGMNIEAKAIVDCFSKIYNRSSDTEPATCYVDIGCAATRAVIAKAGKIQFARVVPIGGDHFSRAVASAMRISLDEARQMRVKLAGGAVPDERVAKTTIATPEPLVPSRMPGDASPEGGSEELLEGTGFALLNAGVAAAERREPKGNVATAVAEAPRPAVQAAPAAETQVGGVSPLDRDRVDQACREPLTRLVEELSLCRRYYEAAFHNQPVQRLIFVGGEANQRGLCQHIAREMGVAAQVGDPLARMAKSSPAGLEEYIDRRVAQPAWAVAMGLSMGAVPTPNLAAARTSND